MMHIMGTRWNIFLLFTVLVVITVDGQIIKDVVESQIQSTMRLLNTPVPPKGFNFPQIKGPKSLDSKIAIVGAGAAGIHMAYKLKGLGYKKVVVLEKLNRIGGKCWTINYRQTAYEIGATYLTNENTEIRRLVEEFKVGPLLPWGNTSLWTNPLTELSTGEYFLSKNANGELPGITLIRMLGAIRDYILIHRRLFGDYQGQLMKRPDEEVMRAVNGTVRDFLARHNLMILEPVFEIAFTMNGYGDLDESAALYGLMWFTPQFFVSVLRSIINPGLASSVLEKGLSTLWEEIVKQRQIEVRLNQQIYQIIRTPNNVYILYNNPSQPTWMEMFDFLIITPSMSEMLNILDTNLLERQLFSMLKPSFFTASLLDLQNGRRGSAPRSLYTYNIETKHGVWIQRDSYAMLNNLTGIDFSSRKLPGGKDGKYVQTVVVFQHGKTYPSGGVLRSELERYASQFGITDGKVLLRQTWKYFPRFSPTLMSAGILWDIFALQGQKHTWIIGSSVSHESLVNVLDYNNLLLQNFSPTRNPSQIKL